MTEVICPACKKPISQHAIVIIGNDSFPVCDFAFEPDGYFYGFKHLIQKLEPSRTVDANDDAKPR
jgi:hypothetical protein